jgi:hypothetical protein
LSKSPVQCQNAQTLCNRLQIKELTLTLPSFYKNEKAQLCQAGMLEGDPVKLLERVARARSVVVDRIEDGHTKLLNGEHHLRDSLTTPDSLRRIAERQNGYQSKSS